MHRRIILAGGGLVLLTAVLAPVARAVTTAAVTIDNFTFSPTELTIASGTRVIWTNRDDIPHTITDSDDPRHVKSPPLDTDETYERTFDRAGTYHYFCSLHPHMQGTIVVQ